ncbi:unnamed protein product [Allacma fusca]|uniref:Uncharacterized protein n=1 Tax=Allacma fusca TaxID=39272 RepID=A0A8J2L748_9HEXA|nr:unnamed protein product [Allacma fusca]
MKVNLILNGVTCNNQHNQEFEDDMKLELEPVFFDRNISHVPYDSKNATKLRSIQYDAFKESKSNYYVNLKYVGLCFGKSLQTEKEKSLLFCWHEFKIHSSIVSLPWS